MLWLGQESKPIDYRCLVDQYKHWLECHDTC